MKYVLSVNTDVICHRRSPMKYLLSMFTDEYYVVTFGNVLDRSYRYLPMKYVLSVITDEVRFIGVYRWSQ